MELKLDDINVQYQMTGDGQPLVWVGGTGVGGGVWRDQIAYFSPQFECLSYDLRGTGQSSAPDVPYSVETFVDDLTKMLDQLGIGPAHFVGFSLGSAIIQVLALNHPERVRTATLVSTWSSTAKQRHIEMWFEARKSALMHAPKDVFQAFAFWMFAPSIIDDEPEVVERVQNVFSANSSAQPLHAYIRHFEADLGHDTQTRLHEITCPVLVVYGDEDLITLPRYNRDVADRIAGSTTVEIKGAGHLLWLERPAELNKAIESFLQTNDSTSKES